MTRVLERASTIGRGDLAEQPASRSERVVALRHDLVRAAHLREDIFGIEHAHRTLRRVQAGLAGNFHSGQVVLSSPAIYNPRDVPIIERIDAVLDLLVEPQPAVLAMDAIEIERLVDVRELCL